MIRNTTTPEDYAATLIAAARTLPLDEQRSALYRAREWLRAMPYTADRERNHWWIDVEQGIDAALPRW